MPQSQTFRAQSHEPLEEPSTLGSGCELREQILQIEAEIEELADRIERCRKIILIAKAAAIAGGVLILAIIIGAIRFDPTVMIGAIAAVIGGTVVFGSNTSTLQQTTKAIEAAKARRAPLIVDLEVDGGMLQTKWSNGQIDAFRELRNSTISRAEGFPEYRPGQ